MIYRLLDIPFDVLSDLANLEFNFNLKQFEVMNSILQANDC